MNTPTRLGLYAAGLAVIFATSFATAAAVVPADAVQNWAADSGAGQSTDLSATAQSAPVPGLAVAQDGYALVDIAAPGEVGAQGEISFAINGPDGMPVTDFQIVHTQPLHLIIVRTDGAQFRHLHPVLDESGIWSLPLNWAVAGSYRLYADFVPTATGESLTLTSTVEVAGEFIPDRASLPRLTAQLAGYDVTLAGQLSASESAELTLSVSHGGRPVTTLQPYLGAYGHLVVLREGDLAFLHVHPEGTEPAGDSLSGPAVTFTTQAPTQGRYLLYLEFQVDGVVHTAEFVVDATAGVQVPPGDAHEDIEPAGHGH